MAALILVAAGSIGVIVIKPASQPRHTSTPVTSGTAPQAAAATWVAGQVSPATIISCDPAMCAVLRAHGYPARNLRPLSSQSALKTSGLVVVTPAAQQLFGSSLVTAWAPAALATFGSGGSAVSVRIVAPQGAAAYERAARQDQAARVSEEAPLTQANSIVTSKSATQDLIFGLVDARLAEVIAEAGTAEPIDILGFGNVGTGASAIVPLRYADLAASDAATGMSPAEYVQALRSGLTGAAVRPDRTQLLTLPGGRQVLRVEFLAPSLFGVLSGS